MPATLDTSAEPEASSAVVDANSVLDVSLFDTQQKLVQYLQYAGLVSGDDKITDLQMAKLGNHAAFAKDEKGLHPAYQQRFREALARQPDIAKLAEGGKDSPLFQLVKDYLTARIEQARNLHAELDALPSSLGTDEFNRTRQRALAKEAKYAKDLAMYEKNPGLVNDIALKYPQVLQQGKYLPLGQLALEMGLIGGDRAKAADMLGDVLANAAAHSMLHIAEEVMTTEDADLVLNRRFPERYHGNILAKATDTSITTTSLERAEIFTDSSPELARVQAMRSLLSAHLHALTSHVRNADGSTTPPVDELAQAMMEIKPLVRRYLSATMSLAYHFLGEGPGKDDPRMQKLREHLAAMMDKHGIALLMNAEEASRTAEALAKESEGYLAEKFTGNAEALSRLNTLLEEAAPVQSLARRYAASPSSYAELAARTATGPALGA